MFPTEHPWAIRWLSSVYLWMLAVGQPAVVADTIKRIKCKYKRKQCLGRWPCCCIKQSDGFYKQREVQSVFEIGGSTCSLPTLSFLGALRSGLIKFQNISTILCQLGHRPKFQDCSGQTWTLCNCTKWRWFMLIFVQLQPLLALVHTKLVK